MTHAEILQEIQVMRENLFLFEHKYGIPSEVFFDAYQRGEEPAEITWVLDWAEWASTYKILQKRLIQSNEVTQRLSSNEESS